MLQMPRVVYFVRHGECIANTLGIIAGQGDDSPLTELGKMQAKETADNFRNITFDLVVASPMSRTVETAKIIVNELGADTQIILKPDFTEKDVGEFSGKPKSVYFAFEATGAEVGETCADMQDRVRQGLDWLKGQSFQVALVVTHNGTARMIRTVIDGLPAKDFAKVPQLRNGEYYKVEL